MVARFTRLVRAGMHDIPSEQADHVVSLVVDVVVRPIVKNVVVIARVNVIHVNVVSDVGGFDVVEHRRRDQKNSTQRQIRSCHLQLFDQVSSRLTQILA